MAKLVSSGETIGFTILPYTLDTPLQQELISNHSDYVLGYITHNSESGINKFTYTESGTPAEANNHWSLAIVKMFPYCEKTGHWIVYNCPPADTKLEFGKILSKSYETLHIHNWDTWCVEEKDKKVAVITSWEIF